MNLIKIISFLYLNIYMKLKAYIAISIIIIISCLKYYLHNYTELKIRIKWHFSDYSHGTDYMEMLVFCCLLIFFCASTERIACQRLILWDGDCKISCQCNTPASTRAEELISISPIRWFRANLVYKGKYIV